MVWTTIAGVFLCTGFWTFVTEVYKNRKKKKTPVENMVLGLVRSQLCKDSKTYIKAGGIPEDELGTFLKLGEAYLEAGGNSEVKSLFEQAKAMPTIMS